MTREELIKLGSAKVKGTPKFKKIYQDFLIEDFGSLPEGCFGCRFNSHWTQWVQKVTNNTNIIMEKEITKKNNTFLLKNENTLVYLGGEVIGKNSPDKLWVKWLTLENLNEADKEKRKEIFVKLPDAMLNVEDKIVQEAEVKKIRKQKKSELTN